MRRKQSARTRFLRRIVDSQAKKLYNGLTEKRTAISFLSGFPYPVSAKKRRSGTVSDFAVNAQNVFRSRYHFALDRDDRQPNRRVRTRRTDSCRQLYDAIPAHCQRPGERGCGLSCRGSRSVALSTDEKDGDCRTDRAVGRRYSDQPDLKKRRGARTPLFRSDVRILHILAGDGQHGGKRIFFSVRAYNSGHGRRPPKATARKRL